MTAPTPTHIDQKIGRNITNIRQRADMSRIELARETGIAADQLSQFEAGTARAPIRTLLAIAGALDVSATRFFVDVHQPERSGE